jgi:hypothetical protein
MPKEMLEEQYAEAKAAVKLYTEAETELLKLKLVKKTSGFLSSVLAAIIVFLFAIVAYSILLVSLGFYLSEQLDSMALGFLCSGGGGILIALLALLFARKLVERPIIQNLLNSLANVRL